METFDKKDFYNYVNKDWIEQNEIPDGYNRWSTFNELDKLNQKKLKEIIESTDNKNIKILHNQYLHRNNDINLKYMNSFIKKIRSYDSKKDLLRFVWKKFVNESVGNPINISIDSDYDDSNINILHISGSGIGLPEKEYYFEKVHSDIRTKYKMFMKNYLNIFGNFDCDSIYLIEEKLAEYSYSNVEKRNPELMNNKFSLDVINCNFENLYFPNMFTYLNINPEKINITNPTYLKKFNHLWDCITIRIWKDYFCWLYLKKYGIYISDNTEKLIFDFYGNELNGIKKMKSIDERMINMIDNNLGMELSKTYVQKYFNDKKKKYYGFSKPNKKYIS